jgi:hypothetical protein
MIGDLQLAAVVVQATTRRLARVPITRQLQQQLDQDWSSQLQAFSDDVEEIEFDPGFTPDDDQRFVVRDFPIPDWLEPHNTRSVANLEPLDRDGEQLDQIKGILGFAQLDGEEVVLLQNFSRSHIIKPGSFLFLERGVFQSAPQAGLTLGDRLTAVLYASERRLVFCNFRSTNVILPLMDLYREASEEEIRDVLGHTLLAPEDVESTVANPSQWFRKRFTMLRSSTVLNEYTARGLKIRGQKVGVEVRLQGGKVVFPADKAAAKKLLQFFCEELFRGPITERLFATNSKREAT